MQGTPGVTKFNKQIQANLATHGNPIHVFSGCGCWGQQRSLSMLDPSLVQQFRLAWWDQSTDRCRPKNLKDQDSKFNEPKSETSMDTWWYIYTNTAFPFFPCKRGLTVFAMLFAHRKTCPDKAMLQKHAKALCFTAFSASAALKTWVKHAYTLTPAYMVVCNGMHTYTSFNRCAFAVSLISLQVHISHIVYVIRCIHVSLMRLNWLGSWCLAQWKCFSIRASTCRRIDQRKSIQIDPGV